jgi:hypothetical protein
MKDRTAGSKDLLMKRTRSLVSGSDERHNLSGKPFKKRT